MSILSDFISSVKEWIDDADPSDALVTQWIRMAEERLNNELRTDEQVVRQYATFDDNCAVLPTDWLKTIYVRPQGGAPFEFITNHDYWGLGRTPTLITTDPAEQTYPWPRCGRYTHIGRTLYVWPPIDPDSLTKIEVAYFRKIVPLGDTADAVFYRYPSIYLNTTLTAAQTYLIEDERLGTFATMATGQIKAANDASSIARFSGSPLPPTIRSFG